MSSLIKPNQQLGDVSQGALTASTRDYEVIQKPFRLQVSVPVPLVYTPFSNVFTVPVKAITELHQDYSMVAIENAIQVNRCRLTNATDNYFDPNILASDINLQVGLETSAYAFDSKTATNSSRIPIIPSLKKKSIGLPITDRNFLNNSQFTFNLQEQRSLTSNSSSVLETLAYDVDTGTANVGSATVSKDGRFVYYIVGNAVKRFDGLLNTTTLIAGVSGTSGDVVGTGANARFNFNRGSSLVLADDGTVYLTDTQNFKVKKIAFNTNVSGGVDITVSLVAGSTQGNNNGVGAAAQFSGGFAIVINKAQDTLYVLDNAPNPVNSNLSIRSIIVATQNVQNFLTVDIADNITALGYDQFDNIYYPSTQLFVSGTLAKSPTIAKRSTLSGTSTTAGVVVFGSQALVGRSSNDTVRNAQGGVPPIIRALTVNLAGDIYISEDTARIQKVGVSGANSVVVGAFNTSGSTDGNVGVSRVQNLNSAGIDGKGRLYFTSQQDRRICRLTDTEVVPSIQFTLCFWNNKK